MFQKALGEVAPIAQDNTVGKPDLRLTRRPQNLRIRRRPVKTALFICNQYKYKLHEHVSPNNTTLVQGIMRELHLQHACPLHGNALTNQWVLERQFAKDFMYCGQKCAFWLRGKGVIVNLTTEGANSGVPAKAA